MKRTLNSVLVGLRELKGMSEQIELAAERLGIERRKFIAEQCEELERQSARLVPKVLSMLDQLEIIEKGEEENAR